MIGNEVPWDLMMVLFAFFTGAESNNPWDFKCLTEPLKAQAEQKALLTEVIFNKTNHIIGEWLLYENKVRKNPNWSACSSG